VNDELIVTCEGEIFAYKPGSHESQRVQEALFHEKENIIENCLFGVDININSVKICRLRLWIELLKNAYYTADSKFAELETLPNIDINIKTGNSLLHRFDLQEDLSEVFRQQKFSLRTYKDAVAAYRNTFSKEAKQELLRFIREIKEQFRTSLSNRDPMRKRMSRLRGEIDLMENPTDLFGKVEIDQKMLAKKKKELATLEQEKADIETNKLYEGAFEWRFEFPEVLDDKGNFVGFDVVIGNPPYLTGSAFRKFHDYFNNKFSVAEYQLDLYTFFIEMGAIILNANGFLALITPNSWLKNLKMQKTREFVLRSLMILEINPNISKAFEDAQVDTLIVIATNSNESVGQIKIWNYDEKNQPIKLHSKEQSSFKLNEGYILDVEVNAELKRTLMKLRNNSKYLSDEFEITRGVNPYDKYRGQSQEIIKSKAYHSSFKKDHTFQPELRGKHISIYHYKWDEKHFISYGDWLAAPRDPKFFKEPRILFREIIGDRFVCTVITEDFIIDRSLYIAKPKNETYTPFFIQGILASKLLIWAFRLEKNEFDQLFPKIRLEEFKKLPIPKEVNPKMVNAIEKAVHNILRMKKENTDTTPLEAEIDQLVYQLYGLTEEEIAIVEGKEEVITA